MKNSLMIGLVVCAATVIIVNSIYQNSLRILSRATVEQSSTADTSEDISMSSTVTFGPHHEVILTLYGLPSTDLANTIALNSIMLGKGEQLLTLSNTTIQISSDDGEHYNVRALDNNYKQSQYRNLSFPQMWNEVDNIVRERSK